MKTERTILIAFLLNLSFSVFEFVGGLVTGSAAILSDAVHDVGDAVGIGVSYIMEKKSTRQPDETYTYGYARYSVLGGVITTLILIVGSVVTMYHAISRLLVPTELHYDGMIVFAVVGVFVNLCAAFFTREEGSLNQKAVNLHMLEDVLGWALVLVGAIVMKITNFALLDSLLSMGVSAFILFHAIRNLKEILDLFLEKVPSTASVGEITEHLCGIEGVSDVHHIHLWSLDGSRNCATLHVVTDGDPHAIKRQIREELQEHGVGHVTIETETTDEPCDNRQCHVESTPIAHKRFHH